MSAYLPQGTGIPWAAALLLLGTLALAFLVSRFPSPRAGRIAAWGLVGLALAGADRVTAAEPPGLRMLVIIAGLLVAMKAVVTAEARAAEGTRLPSLRWAAFATLWPGMRPALFARPRSSRPGAGALVRRGLGHAAAGLGLALAARGVWRATGSAGLATLLLLPALSLLLHFGLFDVLAGLWRWAGVDAEAPFRAPLRSASLREFWGRRWNLAFSEMTALAVYRPLRARAGSRAALLGAFAVSGLLHEAAISLPVRAGFGGPLLFFALHGALAQIERDRGPLGRPATLAALLVPLPLLFHLPFLRGVIWPLLGPR
jgi:Membrane bound O-acyl transferase family